MHAIRYFMLQRSWIYVGAVQNIPVTTVLAEPFSLLPGGGPEGDSLLKREKAKKITIVPEGHQKMKF